MESRDVESAMLDRCVAVAKDSTQSAQNQREANVFRLAAMVIRTRFAEESKRLIDASEQYFDEHPTEELDPGEVIRKGWIINLPRLRDMLSYKLGWHDKQCVESMKHRHLNHERYTLAAIDDVISRGRWKDWADMRRVALADPSLMEDIKLVCQHYIADPYAQCYHFWMHWVEEHSKNEKQSGDVLLSDLPENEREPFLKHLAEWGHTLPEPVPLPDDPPYNIRAYRCDYIAWKLGKPEMG